jgi:hypothetical protein
MLIGRAYGMGNVAEGSVTIAGDLSGYTGEVGGLLEVGAAESEGSASGSLYVGGDITGFGGLPPSARYTPIRIGASGTVTPLLGGLPPLPPTPATASGELYVGGDLIAPVVPSAFSPPFTVGEALAGTATGRAIVEGRVEVFNLQVGTAADGDATGYLQAGEISTRRLAVGSLQPGASGPTTGSAVGEVHVAGDVTSSSDLSGIVTVGSQSTAEARGTGALHVGGSLRFNPSRPGSVSVATGVFEVEGISGLQRLIVGSSSSGETTGSVLVRSGGVEGPGGALWSIGTVSGDGSATGVADLTGDVNRFGEMWVGRLGAGSGSADGTLILREGTATGVAMQVGVNLGTGTATGRLHLDQSLVVLDQSILLGEGSQLEIDVLGLVRGTLYGAIDASLATLGGVLEVDFTGPPEAGIYDLIVSGSEDGISGDFDSVVVTGVDPSLVSFGIEIAPLQGRTVEAYRLRLVPEPGTALLLGLGLGVIARVRRHPGRPADPTARTPAEESEGPRS